MGVKYMDNDMEGVRPRGRPQKTWRLLDPTTKQEADLDRSKWRKLIKILYNTNKNRE